MLFCESVSDDQSTFDDLVVFSSQVRSAGLDIRIGSGSVAPKMAQSGFFDAAPYVSNATMREEDVLLVVRGHEIKDAALVRLRRLNAPQNQRTIVYGRFETFQAQIGLRMKLSYVLGESPEVFHVPAGLGAGKHHLPVFGVERPKQPRRDNLPTVLLIGPDLSSDLQISALVALAASRSHRLLVLTDGSTKESCINRLGVHINIFNYNEQLPIELAGLADMALLFCKPQSSYRMQALVANLVVQGTPVADCSANWDHIKYASSMLQGPSDLNAVATFLTSGVLEARMMIGREMAKSKFAASLDGGEAIASLFATRHLTPSTTEASLCKIVSQASSQTGEVESENKQPLVFVPTNGVGLGHAQRTSLIAAEIKAATLKPVFAAFPSCMSEAAHEKRPI